MTRAILNIRAVLLLCVSTAWSAVAGDAPASKSQFLDEFRAALKARDEAAMMELCDGRGVSQEMRSFQRQLVAAVMKQEIKGAKLSPLPAKYPLPMDLGGVHYEMNLPAEGILDVEYANAEAAGFLRWVPFCYGKAGGVYRIGEIVEKEIASANTMPI